VTITKQAAETQVSLSGAVNEGEFNATVTVTVKVAAEGATPPATSTTVTASYSGATINMTGNNDAVLLGLDDTLFTVTSDKGEAQHHVGLNTGGQIRLYSVRATGEGNTLSVSIAAGYKITDVKITYDSTTAASVLTLGTQVIDLTAAEQKSTTLVYDTLDITSFSIKNVHTGGSKNLQTYIKSIEITYEPVTP